MQECAVVNITIISGVVKGESSLIEIKYFPSLQRWAEKSKISSNIMEYAIREKKDFPLKLDEMGTLQLNKKHHHYYQVCTVYLALSEI